MARTSKRVERKAEKKLSQKQAMEAQKPIWRAGIYTRLSVNSDIRKKESIDTQIEIAKEFICRTDDIKYVECYADIGKTGMNFEREGFVRMMTDIRQKKINCVIVKDVSRFGRNYIETGNYLEKIFPFLGVRFISVTDQYDSEYSVGDNVWFSVNLKNVVNELYAKDIAQRVKSAKRLKREMGSYIGGKPPYGFRVKNCGERRVLYPDADTKDIVIRIFQMYTDGAACREIAEELYQKKIQRPLAYYETKEVYCPEGGILQFWSCDTIKRILTNSAYAGTAFTQEPLISKEMFEQVSQRL